ncbi:MAG: UDP-N-acetylglucosamine 1-carboxyvinyltransferase [Planctomycetota bacterium]|jgi:UDP-N-acetylglucosamine 1-carboxyvinyltransferase
MDRFEIDGGVPLSGGVEVSGAKNAALPILAATILADGPCRLEGVPALQDVSTMLEILRTLGVRAERQADGAIETEVADPAKTRAPRELVKTMRASICVLGPLLGRRGRAEVSFPGGCVIGPRPVDLHLAGLAGLGADVRIEGGYIRARASKTSADRELFLGGPFGPTVTGTANVLSAAVLTPGTTVIQSAACEPEVVDLARFLVAMGASVEGIGSPTLTVTGVTRLQGTAHRVIPDRIEAGTLLCAAAMTRGDVTVIGADAGHLAAPLAVLERMGVSVTRPPGGGLRVTATERPRPADVVTLPYPGFPTDLQAQFMALLSVASGNSFVTEKIYPERFIHVAELQRMGAQGRTVVERVYHIDRGYERIEEKLSRLGARIRRTSGA